MADVLRLTALVAESRRFRAVLRLVRRYLAGDGDIGFFGEAGTGKRTLARAVHLESSRAGEPYIEAFAGTLVRREQVDRLLREAGGGTIYLREATLVPEDCERSLIDRLLAERKSRLIIGTTRTTIEWDLGFAGHGAKLREHLNERRVPLPPLRERREDILPLFAAFLARAGRSLERAVEGVSEEAAQAVLAYSWPRNLREMEEVAVRALQRAKATHVTLDDLEFDGLPGVLAAPAEPTVRATRVDERETRVIRDHTLDVLRRSGGDMTRAAVRLGVSVATLYVRVRQYRVDLAAMRTPRRAD